MPARKGHCTNFGLCGKADKRKRLKIIEGEKFVCPECGQPLDPYRPTPRGGFPWRIVSCAMPIVLISAAVAIHRLEPKPTRQSTSLVAGNRGSVLLRLSIASSAGSALAPALAEEFLKRQGAREVQILPGEKEAEVRVQGILPGESSPGVIEVHARGSDSAFEDLARGVCDIGLVSRKINPQEAAQLSKLGLGDMTSPASEHVVALDSVAVIVSRENPVESLTKKQVSLVFTGKIRDWSQAGGSRGPINVYVRDERPGSYDTFKSLVLADKLLWKAAHRIVDERKLSDQVAKDPNGIGAIRLENIRGVKTIAISEEGAMPFLPTRSNIATENYPLTRPLLLYAPANPRNGLRRKFVEFALSWQGQQIVEKNGLVGRNAMSRKIDMPTGTPAD